MSLTALVMRDWIDCAEVQQAVIRLCPCKWLEAFVSAPTARMVHLCRRLSITKLHFRRCKLPYGLLTILLLALRYRKLP